MDTLGRIDFSITPILVDEDNRRIKIRIEPNADRYKIIKTKGESGYLDVYTSIFIPESMMCSALEQASSRYGEMSIHSLNPAIKSLPPYSRTRLASITKQLTNGIYEAPPERAKTHVELREFTEEKHVAFLSVDICKSTLLRKRNPKSFDKSHEVFIQELATLVALYNGTVLKFTGDGFIAYIDYPAFTVQADTAIALGKALVYHLENCINPALNANSLTELSMRVGIEFGLARAKTFSIQATGKSQTDFISDALNFAVKIQESCEVNEVRLGQSLRDLLHGNYLRQLIQVDYDSSDTGEDDYRVYALR